MSTALDDAVDSDVDRVSGRGLLARAVAVVVLLALTLGGTFFGQDADFPFGPFRMYATRNDPDGVVSSLRVEGVDTNGDRFVISAGSVGLRRAEFEGSLNELRTEPALMKSVADKYHANNPSKPALVRMDIVVRRTTLKDGQETDFFTDTTVATWVRP